MQELIVEETIDVPVSSVKEEIVEVAKHVPHKRVPNYTAEQLVDVPVPHVMEEILEV